MGIRALFQPTTLERVLVDVVNLGDDADTTAAVAGGLLSARDGVAGIPARWQERLEYAPPAPTRRRAHRRTWWKRAGEAGNLGAREMLQPQDPQ